MRAVHAICMLVTMKITQKKVETKTTVCQCCYLCLVIVSVRGSQWKRELNGHVSEPMSTWQAVAVCCPWLGEHRRRQPCLGVFLDDFSLTDSPDTRWLFQAVTQTLFWVKTSSSEITPEGSIRGRCRWMCHCLFSMNTETMIRAFFDTLWPESDRYSRLHIWLKLVGLRGS